MNIIVLGSAAGGGVPQWNCRCPVCALAWANDGRVLPRSQSSLAVSADGTDWFLVNASPDLRQQILATPALHPRHAGRDSPIRGVLLNNGDVDHLAGLLTLRERQPLSLYGTGAALDIIAGNALFGVLDAELVTRNRLVFDIPVDLGSGLSVTAFAVPGKVPLYMESGSLALGEETENVVGLEFRAGGRRFVHMPNCAFVSPAVTARAQGADLLMFDGTTFTDDEMPSLGLSLKTAARMGHIAMDGPEGSLARLSGIDAGRKLFIHLNNTNPVLIEGSDQRARVEAAGWEVARDGMEIRL